MERLLPRILVALALLHAVAARAAALPELQLERLQLNDGAAAALGAASGDVLGEGQGALRLSLHYERSPLVLYRDGRELAVPVRDRLKVYLAGARGVTGWLQVAGELHAIGWQEGSSSGDLALPSAQSFAAGSPRLSARAALLSHGAGGLLPHAAFDVALQLATSIPVGTRGAFAREGSWNVVPQLSAGRDLGPVRLGAEVAYDARPPASDLQLQGYGARETTGSALALAVLVASTGPRARLEVSGHLRTATSGPAETSGELLAGIRQPFGAVDLFALGGPGFGHAVGTPAFRVLAGIELRPRRARAGEAPAQPEAAPAPAAPAPVVAPPVPAPRRWKADEVLLPPPPVLAPPRPAAPGRTPGAAPASGPSGTRTAPAARPRALTTYSPPVREAP